MAAKKTTKKLTKPSEKPGKTKKSKTVSVRLDPDMDAFLRSKAGDEAYAPLIRKLIREAKEREERGE